MDTCPNCSANLLYNPCECTNPTPAYDPWAPSQSCAYFSNKKIVPPRRGPDIIRGIGLIFIWAAVIFWACELIKFLTKGSV